MRRILVIGNTGCGKSTHARLVRLRSDREITAFLKGAA